MVCTTGVGRFFLLGNCEFVRCGGCIFFLVGNFGTMSEDLID